MSELLEIIMVVSFGISWPANVMKSYKSRTTKGKSLMFLLLIEFGYIAGIASKFVKPDFIMVAADLALYIRNKKLDMLEK